MIIKNRYLLLKPFCTTAFFALSLTCQGQNINEKPVKAVMSNLAAEAVGVNTHLNYTGSVYGTHYEEIIKPKLIELGTKHIRDHFGNEAVNDRYIELAHIHGIKLLLINNDGGTDLERSKEGVKRLNQINVTKPVIDLIEPANERDNGWDGDWKKLCSYMQDYRNIYKQEVNTASIPLLGPSFANTRNSAIDFGKICNTASENMDIGNLHAYSGLFPESPLAGGWGISFDKAIENYQAICASKPIIETESGYKMSEGGDGHPAVSERTAAKYSPRLVLERLKKGVNRVYFYQLINNSEDFGLLNIDGSPRLQYTALKNFIHLMRDAGEAFSPAGLSYTLTGNLTDVHQMLFQKRDGKFMLIIWQGVNGSNGGTNDNDYKDIENPERKFVLNLSQKALTVNIYRPSFDNLPDGNGIEPVTVFKNKSSINLAVPDHIIIVEISLKK